MVVAHATGEPQALVKAMVENYENYENVEVVHMVAMGKGEYMKSEMEKHFMHNAIFVGATTREAIAEGRGDYTPCYFSEVPNLFRNKLPVDVALVQVSKPDAHGYCSFGVSCDYTKPAAQCAKIVIAQVNNHMPRALGDNFIHIDDIDYIVEKSEPLIELQPPRITDIERKIGEYCSRLIEDGSTLQLGIGAIPDAVLSFLGNKKDLGIHSEMISDGVIELVENGNITNRMKKIYPFRSIATFIMGSKKLYDYVNDNPSIHLYPVDYVNNPYIIAQNDKVVSINSAIQIDLMGQVNAETIGEKQFSGVGGQMDFVRGASLSNGGKSIIAMPSVAGKGKISKIVPLLDKGAAVTTSRNDVDYVITEYGIAELKGKTLKERAKELIKIAHPKFRVMLTEEAMKKFQYL